jgi:hypothetical protein
MASIKHGWQMQGGYRIFGRIDTPKRVPQVAAELPFKEKKIVTPFLGPLF